MSARSPGCGRSSNPGKGNSRNCQPRFAGPRLLCWCRSWSRRQTAPPCRRKGSAVRAAQNSASSTKPFSPRQGREDCSHGWSAVRRQSDQAQLVVDVAHRPPQPRQGRQRACSTETPFLPPLPGQIGDIGYRFHGLRIEAATAPPRRFTRGYILTAPIGAKRPVRACPFPRSHHFRPGRGAKVVATGGARSDDSRTKRNPWLKSRTDPLSPGRGDRERVGANLHSFQRVRGRPKATPSPLSQWGQFPIFTGMRVSHRATPTEVAP